MQVKYISWWSMAAGAYAIYHPEDEIHLLLCNCILNLSWVVVDKLMLSKTVTSLHKWVKCQSRWSMNAGVYTSIHTVIEMHLTLFTYIPNIIDL